jgi:D-sedoheptulose 7-phosphate isomerase
MNFVSSYINETIKILEHIDKNKILGVIRILKKTYKEKGRVFFLGVGGSAANASHAVNDFRKLCMLECYAPTDNVSELTARVNDDGWETFFSKWLQVSNLNKKDLIFIFSVGGGDLKKKVSVNLINAINFAKKNKAKIISIVGKHDGYAAKKSNIAIKIRIFNKKNITPHAESMQAIIWHLLVSHPLLKKNKTKW